MERALSWRVNAPKLLSLVVSILLAVSNYAANGFGYPRNVPGSQLGFRFLRLVAFTTIRYNVIEEGFPGTTFLITQTRLLL